MKNSKKVALYIALIIVISIVSGFIYGLNSNLDIGEYLKTLGNNNSLFFTHGIIYLLIVICTLSLVNVFFESFIFSIEGISIGFIFGLFYKLAKMKGILYGLITVIINKGIYLLLLGYLFLVSIRYSRKVIKNILGLNHDYVKFLFKPLFLKFLIIYAILLINDTLIYFFGNMFLKYLTFML